MDDKDSRCNMGLLPHNMDCMKWWSVQQGLWQTASNCTRSNSSQSRGALQRIKALCQWCRERCFTCQATQADLNLTKVHLDVYLATAEVILEQNVDPG
jgi:hypothetical protein